MGFGLCGGMCEEMLWAIFWREFVQNFIRRISAEIYFFPVYDLVRRKIFSRLLAKLMRGMIPLVDVDSRKGPHTPVRLVSDCFFPSVTTSLSFFMHSTFYFHLQISPTDFF